MAEQQRAPDFTIDAIRVINDTLKDPSVTAKFK